MSLERHADPDIGVRGVAVQRAGIDSVGQLVVTRPSHQDWVLTLTAGGQRWHGNGPDLFNALKDLRRHVDVDGVLIGLNGARPECAVSGMLLDMGEGRTVYLLKGHVALALRRLVNRNSVPRTVPTLGPAPLDEVSDVTTQDAYRRRTFR